jgi:nucleoside-diphosphate-sugar epimerase
MLPPQPGDMAHTLADINQARALLCWEPQMPLEEGIRSFLDWFAQQPDDGDEEE